MGSNSQWAVCTFRRSTCYASHRSHAAVRMVNDYDNDKVGWGCAARFPKPLPCLWPKSGIFPTLFITDLTIKSKPCFKPALWYVPYFRAMFNCRKHNLRRAFLNLLFDDHEKPASSWKHPTSRLECKHHSLVMTKMAKLGLNRYPNYDQNAWKIIPFRAARVIVCGWLYVNQYPSSQVFGYYANRAPFRVNCLSDWII